jgi:hypothetical protein
MMGERQKASGPDSDLRSCVLLMVILLISVPSNDRKALESGGVAVTINGAATTLRRVGQYLHYKDRVLREFAAV